MGGVMAAVGGGGIGDVLEGALWGALTGASLAVAVFGVVGTIKFLKAHVANKKIVNAVIQETLAGKGNITSNFALTEQQARMAGKKFVQKGFSTHQAHGGGDVFMNKVGGNIHQFRMDAASMLGSHKPHFSHFHLEVFVNSTAKKNMVVNNHIRLLL